MMKKIVTLALCSFLLVGCGPTLLSVGMIDVTAGDIAVNGVKNKIIKDKKDK